jgi:hypothetical protein
MDDLNMRMTLALLGVLLVPQDERDREIRGYLTACPRKPWQTPA